MKLLSFIFNVFFFGMLFSQTESLYEIQKLPFCAEEFGEYNLIPSEKGAYYVSNHAVGSVVQIKDQHNDNLSSIFYQDNINAKKSSRRKIDLGMTFHVGSFCVNEKLGYLIFTAQKSKTDYTLGLFLSERKKQKWTTPRLLYEGYEGMDIMDPFLTSSGDTLFFVGSLTGGKGGTDIYLATGEVGHWKKIRALEETVNTTLNERYPRFYNHTLYYSSTRIFGNGGLDVYSVRLTDEGFINQPFHYPSPINSEFDDFAYVPTSEGMAYFSSNRYGDADLFKAKLNYPSFDCLPYEKQTRCFEFYEESEASSDSTLYQFEWLISDGAKYYGDVANHCFAREGVFEIQLNLVDKLRNEFSENVATYEIEIKDTDQLEFEMPERITKNTTLGLTMPKGDPEVETTYFWDFGDGSYSFGRDVSHTYTAEGQFQISLGEIKIANGIPIKKCTSKIITVIQ